MKTLDGWNNSGLGLGEYLTEPCEIDEELHNYIMEVVAPHYCSETLGQGGDPVFSENSGSSYYIEDVVFFYMTVSLVNGKYFYLGELPEFKQ